MGTKGRRTFLQILAVGILSLFSLAWNKLTLSHLEQLKQKVRIFPFNKNKQVTFFDDFVVVNHDDNTNVLSTHCTHLGCKIDKTENGKLVCPCHGSEYDLEGKVLKGPAYKNLEAVPSKISEDKTQIEIGSNNG